MTDDVRIVFSADISALQRGLVEAQAGVTATSEAMRSGAASLDTSFSALNQAYAAGVARRLDLVETASDDELAAARAGDRAQTDIALDSVKQRQVAVREGAQLSQISHDQELTQLLTLETEREDIERRHLVFLQSTYADKAAAFANTQRQIDELAAQSALKRQEIERSYLREVDANYKRSFEQVFSSVGQQITGLIRGQETLRQAVANIALSIVQSFIQARIRAVADWAAGVVAQTTLTQAGEAAKTAAVTAGTVARRGAEETAAATSAASTLTSVAKSIVASAAETFAGIFGFLSPVLGPAAAAPALAGQATVLGAAAALPSFDTGAWSLPADMIAQVHAGEMIVPAGPAQAMREATGRGGAGVSVQHQTHFHVAAMDSRDVSRFLRSNGKAVLRAIDDSVRKGAHLGLSKVGGAGGS